MVIGDIPNLGILFMVVPFIALFQDHGSVTCSNNFGITGVYIYGSKLHALWILAVLATAREEVPRSLFRGAFLTKLRAPTHL